MIFCKLRLLLTKDFVHSRDESLQIHNVKNWLAFIAMPEKGTGAVSTRYGLIMV